MSAGNHTGLKRRAESLGFTAESDSKVSRLDCHEMKGGFVQPAKVKDALKIKEEPVPVSEIKDWAIPKYLDQIETDCDQVLSSEHNDCATPIDLSKKSTPQHGSSFVKEKDDKCRDLTERSSQMQVKTEVDECSKESEDINPFALPKLAKNERYVKEPTSGGGFLETSVKKEADKAEIKGGKQMEPSYDQAMSSNRTYPMSYSDQSLVKKEESKIIVVAPDEVNNKPDKTNHLPPNVIIENDQRLHVCLVCSKTYTQSGTLKTHMRSHTGEKPYVCFICTKSFASSGKLTIHMRTHSGDKPYKCSVCDKSFTQSGHLAAHMKIHTGEKPYTCFICMNSFTRAAHLSRHMRTHTANII